MEWWQQLLIALVGGGATGALVTQWAQWTIEKARLRTQRRRELVDDAWGTARFMRANTRDVAPRAVNTRSTAAARTPCPEVEKVHDLQTERSVLRILEHLTAHEREQVESHHLVDTQRREGLDALERGLRRLSKKWRLS